jgi:AcrR family transcriptional regulator
MAEVVRPYRGVSADDRRSQRRAQLLEATLDLVGSDGLGNVTMRGVCAQAGLTERYFYESFRGLDDLLETMYDTIARENDRALLDAMRSTPPDLHERSLAALGALIANLTDDPRKARFHVEATASAALKERHARGIRTGAAVLAGEMRELSGLDETRAQVAALVIVSGVGDAITEWLDGRLDISRDELIAECARLCVAATR